MLIDGIRKINVRLNERLFGDASNTYRIYLEELDRRLPSKGILVDLGAGSVSISEYVPRIGEDGILDVAVDTHFAALARNCSRGRVVANAEFLPFREGTVDVIAASCVFEHIERPPRVLSECNRVLKRCGALVFYTPNRYSYVAAIGRMTPLPFHRLIRILQTGKLGHEAEVCPTLYKLNAWSDLLREKGEFQSVSVESHIGAPCYTTFLPPPAHVIFIILHKTIQRVPWLLRIFGESLIGRFVK